ncbi:MAG: hypothetical protein ALECFALPRED_001284 [Alectoria fallacina]|uniref:F-box domain-containing protein n=1 Tax=Alectoria fallacina TaxID=1903189 RepID=A0A8H3JAV1_9LECA|nr:MAG: hypothetical protein ALECFALPRED_001284 [Alectoria fallacina]
MPLLPDLPNELLGQIMRYLLPDDVDSFSNSCQHFHTLSVEMFPRHKELKKEYSQVFCGVYGSHKAFNNLSLFRKILKDSEIVWYVKTMFIGLGDFHCIRKDKETWDDCHDLAVECKDGIIKTVHSCPYLDDGERERWINGVLSSDQNTTVTLLASMLPCLEYICFTDNYANEELNDELHVLVRNIDQARRLDPGGLHALSKLECVQERGQAADDLQYMPSFEPLSRLPSMRRYIGRYLYHEDGWTPPEKKSTITSLELIDCMIHIAALRSALSGIENLRDFTYESYWAWEEESMKYRVTERTRDWQPGEIILNLLEFAGHSLVNLGLTRNSRREDQRREEARGCMKRSLEGKEEKRDYRINGVFKWFMGSLRGFEVLEKIRVQNEMLVEEAPDDKIGQRVVHRLVDLLPVSISEVSLAKPLLDKEDWYRLMEGLQELRVERVPRLERVICEGLNHKGYMDTVFEADGLEFIPSEAD